MSLQTSTTIRVRQWKLISQGEDTSRAEVSSRDASTERPTIVGLKIGTLGLMSGGGKRSAGHSSQATAPTPDSTRIQIVRETTL